VAEIETAYHTLLPLMGGFAALVFMTSMCNDLLRGNRLELPWFAGKVVELGRLHGIPTPANGFVHAALKLYVNGPPA
jgi:2-dehydropantoate 2-reductase